MRAFRTVMFLIASITIIAGAAATGCQPERTPDTYRRPTLIPTPVITIGDPTSRPAAEITGMCPPVSP